MKGALVFLAVFIIFLAVTLAYTDLPPGKQIYDALNLPTPQSPYLVFGIDVTTLIKAVFNGVIYGVIAWIIYSIAARATKKKEPAQKPKPA